MTDMKTAFIRDVLAEMTERGVEMSVIRTINKIMLDKLTNVDMVKAENTLSVIDETDEQMLKVFAATKKIEGASNKTVERYLYILRRVLRETQVPIQKTTVFVLRRYLAGMELRGTSINTIAGERSIIRSFYGWLQREGFIERNPAEQLGTIKTHKRLEAPYTAMEMERIRTACENERDRAMVEFLRCTGCRIDEVCRLNQADINYRDRCVKVIGKGNKERIVYIDDPCVMHLQRYLEGRRDREALFDGRATERITAGGVRAALKRLEEISGVDNVHPHRFRRTLATNMIRRGMNIQDVARILGHAKLDTTMIYVYADDTAVENAYRKYM